MFYETKKNVGWIFYAEFDRELSSRSGVGEFQTKTSSG